MKERILKTALCLFLDKGFSGVKVMEIAEVLQISKKTIYNHFKNKRQLYIASAAYFLEEAVNRLEKIALSTELDFQKRIRKLLELTHSILADVYRFDDMRQINQPFSNLVLFPELRKKVKLAMEKLILEGIQKKIIRRDIHQNILINSLMLLIISQFDADKRDISFQAEADFSIFIEEIVFKGILTDEGKKEFKQDR